MKKINFKYKIGILALASLFVAIVSCQDEYAPDLVTYPDITVEGFMPKTGRPGTQVTIQGTNFGDRLEPVAISFNETVADNIVSITDSTIVVVVPVEAGVGPITVKVWTHTKVTAENFDFQLGAELTSVDPLKGRSGDEITITGVNFGEKGDEVQVLIGETSAELISVSDNEIKFTVPDGSSGTLSIIIGPQVITGPNFVIAGDITELTGLITNPSFETGDLTGWDYNVDPSSLAWVGVNTDGDATKSDDFITGIWDANIPDIQLSQTVTGLDNGLYILTADVSCAASGDNSRLTTQRLFAGNQSMLFGRPSDYSKQNLQILADTESFTFGGYEEGGDTGPFQTLQVVVEVVDNELTFGIRTNGLASTSYTFPSTAADGAGRGWYKVDNFTLSQIGESKLTGLLQNPSFEAGDATGWDYNVDPSSLAWVGVNTDGDATKSGDFITGIWDANIPDFELSQTVTGLDNGLYLVTADVSCASSGDDSRLTTQRLFAGNQSMLFGSPSDYSQTTLDILTNSEIYSFGGYEEGGDIGPFQPLMVVARVVDNQLTFGIRTNGLGSGTFTFESTAADGAGRGWFKADNFNLQYLGK